MADRLSQTRRQWLANAGAADPIALASPFAIQPEATAMIPSSEMRNHSDWKSVATTAR